MSAYHYSAIKSSGQSCKGVIDADSERHARQLLREQGLIPTRIHVLKKNIAYKRSSSFSAADLSLFTRQLATLLAAGIPLEEAIRGVSEQTNKPNVRQLLIQLRSKVLEGYSLAQAMDDNKRAFPELYRATIAAGEQTGHLDQVLEKLADYTEYQQQIRQKVQQAMIYPTVMVVISVSIIAFLLSFVVPKIIDVFNNSGQTLPFMTQLLLSISAFIQHQGIYALGLLLIIGLIGYKSLKNPRIKLRWHGFLLKIPGLSFLMITRNVARYTHTFSILFASGVNVLETMRVASRLLNNIVMQNAFDRATLLVKEGTNIHQALRETHYLNAMTLHLIGSGEKSGQLAPMMERSALQLDQEVRRIIDTAMTLLEPMVILFMGAVILFIVLATLLPIFSMEQLVA